MEALPLTGPGKPTSAAKVLETLQMGLLHQPIRQVLWRRRHNELMVVPTPYHLRWDEQKLWKGPEDLTSNKKLKTSKTNKKRCHKGVATRANNKHNSRNLLRNNQTEVDG